jgi:hypothetical protein
MSYSTGIGPSLHKLRFLSFAGLCAVIFFCSLHNKGGMMLGHPDLLLALQTEGTGNLNRNLCFCSDCSLWP